MADLSWTMACAIDNPHTWSSCGSSITNSHGVRLTDIPHLTVRHVASRSHHARGPEDCAGLLVLFLVYRDGCTWVLRVYVPVRLMYFYRDVSTGELTGNQSMSVTVMVSQRLCVYVSL